MFSFWDSTPETHTASLFTGNSFLILILLKIVGAKHSPSQRQYATCCITSYWKEHIMCNIPLLSENMSHTSFFPAENLCHVKHLICLQHFCIPEWVCHVSIPLISHKNRAVWSPVPLFTSSVRKKKKPSLLGREHHTSNFSWMAQAIDSVHKPRTAFLFNRKVISCPSPALLGPYAIYSTMSYQE